MAYLLLVNALEYRMNEAGSTIASCSVGLHPSLSSFLQASLDQLLFSSDTEATEG